MRQNPLFNVIRKVRYTVLHSNMILISAFKPQLSAYQLELEIAMDQLTERCASENNIIII